MTQVMMIQATMIKTMIKVTSKVLFRFLLLLLFAALTLPSLGQSSQKPLSQMPASARQLIAIKVVGSKRYSERAIAAATGLQMGAPVDDDDFKRASRRLGDMGVFTEIAYSFSYSSAGTKLELHVADAQKFVPARFEDFVWFSDDELRKRIQQHAPLFDGELPLFGRLADEVSDVLQAMLVERSIPGHVEYLRTGKQDGPVEAITYHVNDVLIRIRNFEFTGASPDDVPALESAGRRLGDREYSRTRLHQLVEHQLLPVYFERGYLKAEFGPPVPKVVKEPSAENEDGPRNQTVVDVTFAVTPGPQYKLKSLGLVRQSRVSRRNSEANGARRTRQARQHHPHRRQRQGHPETLRLPRIYHLRHQARRHLRRRCWHGRHSLRSHRRLRLPHGRTRIPRPR